MIIDKGIRKFESLNQVDILKDNLIAKYKLTDVKNYGSCLVLKTFSGSIVAEIFIEGFNIRYQVNDHLFYER